MKKLVFTVGLIFISLIVFSQNGIYRSYDDFKNNKLEDIGEFSYGDKSGASAHLNYIVNGKKKKLACKDEDFWGFMYEGQLFRNNHDYGGLAYIVISVGDYVYYENGGLYIRVLDNLKVEGSKSVKARPIGYFYPISLNLNSDFVSTNKVWAQFKKLEKKNPRFTNLKECYGKGPTQEKMRDCVKEDIKETKNFYPWDNLIPFSVVSY